MEAHRRHVVVSSLFLLLILFGLVTNAISASALLDFAEEGLVEAQFMLGWAYEHGSANTPKNLQEAAKWYRKAADQGHAEAQYRYAYLLDKGSGVKKNPAEAAKWFRMAAEQGFAAAQVKIAQAYHEGRGVPKDYAKAVDWLEQAAENGDAWGQCLLGVMYRLGEGVAKNPKEAFYWFRRAAMQGFALAQYDTAICYKTGTGVIKDETEALAWFNLAAALGDEDAIRERAMLENRLGQKLSIAAQQRSRDLEQEIAKESRQKPSEQPKNGGQGLDKGLKATGTGVLVTNDGYILTAAHVVSEATSVKVITETGTQDGVVTKVDKECDVALLKCKGKFKPAPIKLSRDVKLGQSVFTIGFPNIGLQGLSPKMTRGEISSLSGFKDDPKQWQISVPLQPGNSGGPLFDDTGNVIGIILSKLDALKVARKTGDLPQNVNYAVKSASFMPMVRGMESTLASERTAFLGSKKIETTVEEIQGSVVLILVY
jgi:uncharacterized protein